MAGTTDGIRRWRLACVDVAAPDWVNAHACIHSTLESPILLLCQNQEHPTPAHGDSLSILNGWEWPEDGRRGPTCIKARRNTGLSAVLILLLCETAMLSGIFLKKMPPRTIFKVFMSKTDQVLPGLRAMVAGLLLWANILA